MKDITKEDKPTTVAEAPKQVGETQVPERWKWVEPSVWTERMLTAHSRPVNPDVETTDWRAGCGKLARPVRREGRRKPSLPLSDDIKVFIGRHTSVGSKQT